MNTKVKYWIFRCVLIFFSAGMFFIFGEVALRVLYAQSQAQGGDLEERLLRSKNTDLSQRGGDYNMSGLVQPSAYSNIVYELKPNLEGTFREKAFHSNSMGIRDKEYTLEKPDGTFRIMGIGDSVMFGWGVHQGEAYLDLIEERLNKLEGESRRFETFNFALPGYNTTMEVATLEHRAMAYDPDLIIIQFVNNDLGVPLFMQRPKEVQSARKSYFYEFIATRIGWIRADRDNLVGNQMKEMEEAEQEETLDRYRHMTGDSGYRKATDRLAQLAREKNIPVLMVQGSSSGHQKKLIEGQVNKHGFHPLIIKPFTDAWIEQEGIENTKSARRKAIWVSASDHHPNQHGHRIYADGLMDLMRKLKIIDFDPETMDWVRPLKIAD